MAINSCSLGSPLIYSLVQSFQNCTTFNAFDEMFLYQFTSGKVLQYAMVVFRLLMFVGNGTLHKASL